MGLMEISEWSLFAGNTAGKLGDGLGLCNIATTEVGAAVQGIALPPAGQKFASTGLQTERITPNCMVGFKTDAPQAIPDWQH
jgi:hypothetical protein